MRFYTHIAGGILLFTLLVWIFNLPFSIAGLLFTGWISVLPDLVDRVIGEHRGWGHSVIWLIPIVFSFLLNSTLGIAFLSGYMMHILFDIVTKKGVPFLYPFSATRLVMPKKEKSRIITGSKQEIALFIVSILLFAPVAYGVVCGYDLGSALGAAAGSTLNKTNKTNGTLSNLIRYATGNLRSNSSYPQSSYSSKYNSGYKSGNSKKNSSSTSQNSSTNSNSDQGLLDWLINNHPTEDTSSDTNQTNDNTNSNIITDVLFNDMGAGSPYDNLQEGQYIESPFNASSDNSSIDFLDDFGFGNAGDEGYFNSDDWSSYMVEIFLLNHGGI
jgi:membrane-bound metal-dependent hydrolase YbcI (DUF457 family)